MITKAHRLACSLLWASLLQAGAVLATEPASGAAPDSASGQRILFVGNSYTEQIRPCLEAMRQHPRWQHHHFSYITRSGARLQEHLANAATLAQLREGQWDQVVLQEQSQLPALEAGRAEFEHSMEQWISLVRATGATPWVYLTWGRRDGDPVHLTELPDYSSMQVRLNTSYQQVALHHQAELAPVGLAWAWVREQAPTLGLELYNRDGSHPSTTGACLAAAVFFQQLLGSELLDSELPPVVETATWSVLRAAALAAAQAMP